MPSWRYYAFRLPDLVEVHGDLPLSGVTFSEGLSRPGNLEASLSKSEAFVSQRITEQFAPVRAVEERGTLIVAAEDELRVAHGFIVNAAPDHALEQDKIKIQAEGVSTVLWGTPWFSAPWDGVDVDPLDVARMLLAEASSYQDSLTVTGGPGQSETRIGEELREVVIGDADDPTADFEAGPRPRLASYRTPDMMKVFSDMALECPFEWREAIDFNFDGTGPPSARIEFGHPTMTPRDPGLRFEIGGNVTAPSLMDPTEYASEVWVLGAGEAADKRRGYATSSLRRRLRTVKTIEDSSLTSNRACQQVADRMLARIEAEGRFIGEFTVKDSESAPIGSFRPGDVINLIGDVSWGEIDQTCRITEIAYKPADAECAVTVERWEE